MVVAALVLLGPQWKSIPRALQIALFAVPAALLIVAALIIALSAGDRTPVSGAPAARRRVVAVLLVVGSALGAAAAAVIAGPDSADRAAMTTAFALLLGGYRLCRSMLTHLSILVSGAGMVVSWTVWVTREFTATESPSFPLVSPWHRMPVHG